MLKTLLLITYKNNKEFFVKAREGSEYNKFSACSNEFGNCQSWHRSVKIKNVQLATSYCIVSQPVHLI